MKALLLLWLIALTQQSTSEIRLVASTPKSVYQAGEKISITYYLVNRGKQGIFVYRPTPINFFFYDHFGGVSLEIRDAKTGQPADFRKFLKHSASGESLSPIPERVRGYYDYLPPGGLIGLVDEFDTKDAKLKPGVYDFRLSFGDREPESWSKEELSALSAPVFSGRVESNAIRITIVLKK